LILQASSQKQALFGWLRRFGEGGVLIGDHGGWPDVHRCDEREDDACAFGQSLLVVLP
jgi:hypothetical protein